MSKQHVPTKKCAKWALHWPSIDPALQRGSAKAHTHGCVCARTHAHTNTNTNMHTAVVVTTDVQDHKARWSAAL